MDQLSDRRLKVKISEIPQEELTDIWAKWKELNFTSYEYKDIDQLIADLESGNLPSDDKDLIEHLVDTHCKGLPVPGEKCFGLIAQDLSDVFPDCVRDDFSQGMYIKTGELLHRCSAMVQMLIGKIECIEGDISDIRESALSGLREEVAGVQLRLEETNAMLAGSQSTLEEKMTESQRALEERLVVSQSTLEERLAESQSTLEEIQSTVSENSNSILYYKDIIKANEKSVGDVSLEVGALREHHKETSDIACATSLDVAKLRDETLVEMQQELDNLNGALVDSINAVKDANTQANEGLSAAESRLGAEMVTELVSNFETIAPMIQELAEKYRDLNKRVEALEDPESLLTRLLLMEKEVRARMGGGVDVDDTVSPDGADDDTVNPEVANPDVPNETDPVAADPNDSATQPISSIDFELSEITDEEDVAGNIVALNTSVESIEERVELLEKLVYNIK